jgi:glycerol-3-phosphate acyltransferase PlsX
VAAAHFLIKLLPGVLRPGIAVTLPTAKGETILCDAGANIHCKPLHLLHYGIMAARWSKAVFGHDSPTVGLLNIGSEEGKGNELVRETSALFTDAGLNFLGNVEGNDVFNGRCDVIVCEGFVGNVVLKTAEGLYEVIASRVKELMRDITTAFTACGAPMAPLQEAVGRFRGNMDWAEHGGAPLLGLNGLVLISHGRSDARAIRNAILQAARIHRKQVLRAMAKDLVADASKSAS